jgi:hypothetical protein
VEEISLHLNVLQRVAFLFLKLAYSLQWLVSFILMKTFGLFLLFLANFFCGDRLSRQHTLIRFERGKITYRLIALPFKYFIFINGVVSGLRGNRNSYEFLLRWMPNVPLIAIYDKKINYQIRWLGYENAPSEEEPRSWSLEGDTSVGSSSWQGAFKIINKELSGDGSVIVKCVWLSGDNSGKVFQYSPSFVNDLNQITVRPQYIYFPPMPVVFFLEAIVSISVVTLLVSALYHSLMYLVELGWFEFHFW